MTGSLKSGEWAAPLTDIEAKVIRALARRMASKRTMVNVTWAIQRAIQGEQPFWGIVALASLLGQIGTPGGGSGALLFLHERCRVRPARVLGAKIAART